MSNIQLTPFICHLKIKTNLVIHVYMYIAKIYRLWHVLMDLVRDS